ncbi:primase [Fenollaria massiliensis]|uniref:primase n=1 Tax=Fenollaria massiliensis TaxID=938288 RepID=UPI00037C4980|nr:primase [Fenollaria massiliensis]
MKKKISLLLAILMLVTLIPTAFAESKTVDAVKNTKKVTLDGEEVMVGAYDVEGFNYLKLRDVAAILNAKKCQFSVGYDEPTKLISVELAKAYEKVEGDLAEIKDEKAKAIVSVKNILVNGEEKEIKTALINEYNYMQLRDLGSLVGLDVKYDAKNKVIMLKSDAEAKEEEKKEEKKDEKTDDKKEEKKDEKTDDKKDEKKEEKTKNEKSDDKKYSEEENKVFNFLISMINQRIEKFKNFANVPFTGNEEDDFQAQLINMSILHGRRLYMDGARIEKKITMEEGKKCYVVEFTYPSGGKNTIKAAIEEGKEGAVITESLSYSPIIGLIDKSKDIRKLSKDELKEKFTKVHDAFGANDYKKAAELLRELNYDANEDKVKELVELKRADAKRFGREIFSKDYKVSVETKDLNGADYVLVVFRYNNGMAFRFDIYPEAIEGLGTMFLYTDQY